MRTIKGHLIKKRAVEDERDIYDLYIWSADPNDPITKGYVSSGTDPIYMASIASMLPLNNKGDAHKVVMPGEDIKWDGIDEDKLIFQIIKREN